MAEGIERCAPEDPTRCQAGDPRHGQCINRGLKLPDGSYGKYCKIHGGNRAFDAMNKATSRTYLVERFKSELDEKRRDPNIKNLRDDIAVIRLLLETKLKSCENEKDLLLHSGPIMEMSDRVQKAVTACHKLELSMGQYLDKQDVLTFAANMIEAVSTHVKDPEILKAITADLQSAIWRLEHADSSNDDPDI